MNLHGYFLFSFGTFSIATKKPLWSWNPRTFWNILHGHREVLYISKFENIIQGGVRTQKRKEKKMSWISRAGGIFRSSHPILHKNDPAACHSLVNGFGDGMVLNWAGVVFFSKQRNIFHFSSLSFIFKGSCDKSRQCIQKHRHYFGARGLYSQ